MNTPETDIENSDLLVARIDALDELYVAPIREYLIAHGCTVVVNATPSTLPLYHIVYGDMSFVKEIFASQKHKTEKSLVVLWGGTKKEVESLVRETGVRVWVTGDRHLDHNSVNELFAFFFGGNEAIHVHSGDWESHMSLALQKNDTDKKQKHPSVYKEKDFTNSFEGEDKKRIKDSIETIFGQRQQPAKTPTDTSPVRGLFDWFPHAVPTLPTFRSSIFLTLSATALLLLPFIWYATAVSVGALTLYWGSRQIQVGDANAVARASTLSQTWTSYGKGALSFIAPPLRVIGLEKEVRGQEHMLSLLDNVATSERGIRDLMVSGKEAASLLLVPLGTNSTDETSPAVVTQRLQSSLLFVQNSLGLAQAELARLLVERPFILSFPRTFTLATNIFEKLTRYHESMTRASNVLALYPQIAGFKEKKTYLILLQNSMELRPTGGFIGSVGIATFSDGRLSDLQIQDVYALDGQLKGHVDPPGPLRDLLGQEHWYLRDSNWDPDFRISGKQAAWFYEKETGNSVDGVIAISVPLIIDLLKVTGPIDLSDYNDRITADNFFGKSLYYTRTDFFPGSTQKKDFLGSLTSTLLAKLTSSKAVSLPLLFTTIATGLSRGDILLYFTGSQEATLIDHFGWGGKVPITDGCFGLPPKQCSFDPHSLIEANVGVNKVNYYLDRTMLDYVVLGEDGTADETLTISYHNAATTDHPATGGGVYKAYARLYIPGASDIKSVTLDGLGILPRDTKKKALPKLPYWEETLGASGTKVIGIALEVPEATEKKLSVSYHEPNLFHFDGNSGTYEFLFQKQPGLIHTKLQTQIVFPIFWTAKQETGDGSLSFLAKEGKLEYNTNLAENQIIRIKFSK